MPLLTLMLTWRTFLQITMKKLRARLTSLPAISEKGLISELIYLITTSPKVPVSCVEWEVLKGKQSMDA